MLSYRKTKTGDWVVVGLVSEVVVGDNIVTKKDGTTKTEVVMELGTPFTTPEGECVYGYIRPSAPEQSTREDTHSGCAECGMGIGKHPRYDSSGIKGFVCDKCRYISSVELSFA